ncbi:MAG: alpha/beta hydrolase [Rhodopila sp.]|nr:alpha/beta hydrolase [Rhodopila sp.]
MRAGTLEIPGGMLETGWWGPEPTEAPTLVLLHEGLGSVALWRDVPERLAASTGWGVFAYSRFGYGCSDATPLPRPMTYMHHEAQVVLPEVLAAAGIKRAVLVGHSDGGSIAAIYAGTKPHQSPLMSWPGSAPSCPSVSSPGPAPSVPPMSSPGLAPFSPPVSWPGLARPPTTCDAASNKVVGDRAKPGHDTEGKGSRPILIGLVTIAAHFFVEDLNIASIRQIKTDYATGDLRQRLARYHRDVDTAFRGWNDAWLDPRFRAFDITGFLPYIQVPILAVQGTDDPYGTDEQLRVLGANVQAPITTHLIPGARHSPHLEAKDATLAAITSFIADLPRGSST